MRILKNILNTKQPDISYPKGNIRNKDTGALPPEDGTPVVEEVYGDIIQLFQRITQLGNVTENDLPDNLTNGYQLMQAFRNVFMKNTLITERVDIATPTALTAGDHVTMAGLNSKMFAYLAEGDDNLRAFILNTQANNIAATGTPLPIPENSANAAMAQISENTVVIANDFGNTYKVYTYSGDPLGAPAGTFSEVASLAEPGISAPGVCKVSDNIFAGCNYSQNSIKIYEFNGVDTITEIGSYNLPEWVTGDVMDVCQMAENRIGLIVRATGTDRIYAYEWSQAEDTLTQIAKSNLWFNLFNENFVAFNDTDVFISEAGARFRQLRLDGDGFKEIDTFYNNAAYVCGMGIMQNNLIMVADDADRIRILKRENLS